MRIYGCNNIVVSEMKLVIFGIIAAVIIILIAVLISRKRNDWVSTDDFQNWKKRLNLSSDIDEYTDFMRFLKVYKGGYIRRRSGTIVYQDYLNKEKGDLKGIFFNLIIPSSKLDIKQKEEFRSILVSIGVDGVDKRPNYETRDSRLKNNKTDSNDYERKKVGNKGEKIVREYLNVLGREGYSVINGPVLRYEENTKEYDHIVVGSSGVFCIETKAFGMSSGEMRKGTLFVEDDDKWSINSGNGKRDLKSPSIQIQEEKSLLERILEDFLVDIRPILVLSNTELSIKKCIDLQFEVLTANELVECIRSNKDIVLENDRIFILQAINNARIN